jgi:hypothetical protein
MLKDRINETYVRGRVRTAQIAEEDRWDYKPTPQSNLIVYDWSKIVGRLLTTADSTYRIAGMYLLFENTVSSSVSLPSFNRSRNAATYHGLTPNPTRDFLRVPLSSFSVIEGSNEVTLRFNARTAGTVGMTGKAFSAAANSLVIGGALIELPDINDMFKDIVFSSISLDPSSQQRKLTTGQVGLEWEITLD